MDRKMLLACITGSVDEELLLRNEYLVAENRILHQQIEGRLRLTDAHRRTLAEIGKKLSKQALEEVATIVKPETILAWRRKLVKQKFDGFAQRKSVGRPRVDKELEAWVVKMAKENRGWGYDRIAGALAELGYDISDQTVGDILRRRGHPHYHQERGHQGLGNVIPFSKFQAAHDLEGPIQCHERLGGLLKFYNRQAA